MTDDELRRALAERLGWKMSHQITEHAHAWLPPDSPFVCTDIPSLSELVITGEGRLTDEQLGEYAKYLNMNHDTVDVVGWIDECRLHPEFWVDMGKLITAPAAVRARALLEVLPESSLTRDGGVG